MNDLLLADASTSLISVTLLLALAFLLAHAGRLWSTTAVLSLAVISALRGAADAADRLQLAAMDFLLIASPLVAALAVLVLVCLTHARSRSRTARRGTLTAATSAEHSQDRAEDMTNTVELAPVRVEPVSPSAPGKKPAAKKAPAAKAGVKKAAARKAPAATKTPPAKPTAKKPAAKKKAA